ncbi:hypothetical protein HMI55_003988 [Coelomomyces lativittatus]|nr:hypothetical protein HMI55_003988 [Coelomomyces lativittatus]
MAARNNVPSLTSGKDLFNTLATNTGNSPSGTASSSSSSTPSVSSNPSNFILNSVDSTNSSSKASMSSFSHNKSTFPTYNPDVGTNIYAASAAFSNLPSYLYLSLWMVPILSRFVLLHFTST